MNKNIIDSIYEIIQKGKVEGIGQLKTEDDFYNSNTITFGKKKHVNFGSYSYLNLERDERLQEAAIDAIRRFGIQYPSSRTYVSSTLYDQLESLLSKVFNAPIALCTTTTLAHVSAMPIVIEKGDLILMDQQVHSSVQFMVNHLKQFNIPCHIVRHNSINQLEDKIKLFNQKFNRIWYLFDGVYSMFGDLAPVDELNQLMTKYKKLHLYCDDAHGMSWTGQNGKGYFLDKVLMSNRVITITSLNKAFSSGGAVITSINKELISKIATCGAPMIFAGQLQTAALGAGIASAKIHLSNEIEQLQEQLRANIQLCKQLLLTAQLPLISNGDTPIFFIGLGLPKTGYNLVKKMMESGFYVNLAIFPAVSETCTGLRFTITKNHSASEINSFVDSLTTNFYSALEEENKTLQDVHFYFRRIKSFDFKSHEIKKLETQYTVKHEKTVAKFDEQFWNKHMGETGTFDYKGLLELEEIFTELDKQKWDFHYIAVYNSQFKPVLIANLVSCLTKDDALENAEISVKIEQVRSINPYYLCSKTLMLGSPLSIGQHMYINKSDNWKKAVNVFLECLQELAHTKNIDTVNLRDLSLNDNELTTFIVERGFIKSEMPSNFMIDKLETSLDLYLKKLRSSQRTFIKKRAIQQEGLFDVEVISKPCQNHASTIYNLYKNVYSKSFELNLFEYPITIIDNAIKSENWEVLLIKYKKEQKHVACSVSYINDNIYHFVLAGLNYDYIDSLNIYPQLLWQIVQQAIKHNCQKVSLGYTTGQSKRKFGATEVKNKTLVQINDDFSQRFLQNLKGNNSISEYLESEV